MNDSGFVKLRRLATDEIVGTEKSAGLIERYFSLMPEDNATLQDIDLSAREMRIGDNRLAAVKPATTAVRRVILVNLCFMLFRYLKIVSSQIIQINTDAIIHELKFNLRESV